MWESPRGQVGCLELRRVLSEVIQSSGRIKVGTPRDTKSVSTHAIYSEVGIKVGTITRGKRK